jgi:hypothetical protein
LFIKVKLFGEMFFCFVIYLTPDARTISLGLDRDEGDYYMELSYPVLWPVLLLAGIFMIAAITRSWGRRELKKLRQRGTHITATVIEVKEKTEYTISMDVGPTFPYTSYALRARWTDPQTGEVHLFMSEWLGSKPAKYTRGSPISILIDPNDPGRYHMEL